MPGTDKELISHELPILQNGHDDPQHHECGAGPWWLWGIIFLVGVLCIARLVATSPLLSANDRSRWCTIRALVEKQTYQIDSVITNPQWDTIDKVRHEDHFYSSKPPLYPTMIAGFVWCLTKVTGLQLSRDIWQIQTITLFWLNIVPFLMSLWSLEDILRRGKVSENARWVLIVLAAFGTSVTPFLMTLNNHTAAAICVTFALWSYVYYTFSHKTWALGSAGFFAGFACCQELPAASFAVVLGILCARLSFPLTLKNYLPLSLLPIVAQVINNRIVTGGWKPFYAYYGTEKYNYEYWGIPSYWLEPGGLDRATDTTAQYLFHCLLGHHGIFSLTPMLILSVIFWVTFPRYKNYRYWREAIWSGVITVVVLGFYLSRPQNYNYGGNTMSLRWTMWMIPLWLITLAPVLENWVKQDGKRGLLILMMGFSIFAAWFPMLNPWQHPWVFKVMTYYHWIDYAEKPTPFAHPRYTLFDYLPTGDKTDPEYWVELACQHPDGQVELLRIADGGPIDQAGKACRKVIFTVTQATSTPIETVCLIDQQAFAAGEQPNKFLVFATDVTEDQKAAITTLITGLPVSTQYYPGFKRYLFTSLQKNALRCQRNTANVTMPESDPLLPTRGYKVNLLYTSDIWSTEELPFGIARWQKTSTSQIDADQKQQLTFTAVRSGKMLSRTPLDPVENQK
jgi:hypothetical protein